MNTSKLISPLRQSGSASMQGCPTFFTQGLDTLRLVGKRIIIIITKNVHPQKIFQNYTLKTCFNTIVGLYQSLLNKFVKIN